MADAKKVTKSKIADRLALNAEGKDQSDYTEACKARYQLINNGPSAERDFSRYVGTVDPVDIAFMIEGFLNKAGHAVNKARNAVNGDGDVAAALADFEANINEGGWTNREGGNEVNLAVIHEAFAKLRNATIERVREVWATYSDEQKQAIRSNPQVKALVAEARAAKARATANAATGTELPEL